MRALLRIRKPKEDVFIPYPGFAPMKPPYFLPGTRVVLHPVGWPTIADWKDGDVGTVKTVCPDHGIRPRGPGCDSYGVELDVERVPGRKVVYLYYKDLARLS